jgi:hypothetical protein
MKRTALRHALSFASAPTLTRPERSSDRLLVWGWHKGDETGGAALIGACVAEGWNVLETACNVADKETTAADIADAVKQCPVFGGTLFIADQDLAQSVCRAVLDLCRSGSIAGAVGLVTLDAFADEALQPLADALAEFEVLATIWAARRNNADVRRKTLAHHTALQARNRETHFVALPDDALTLAQHLADPRDPVGREMRWLLDPVHSRSP